MKKQKVVERIHIRCTTEEKKQIKQQAKMCHESISRFLIREALGK